MSYTKLDLEQGSPEWLQARYDYVTASQTPVLFDLSPYQTRLGLFEEKVRRLELQDKTGKEILFARGHNAEKAGRAYVKEHMGLEFTPAVLVSKEHPFLMASLDGHIESEKKIFEAKFVGKDVLAGVRTGKIPPHHLCQVQAAMLVSGAEKCLYFATDPDGDSHLAEVSPDRSYQSLIATTAKSFWTSVTEGKPPEMSDRDFFEPEDKRFERLADLDAALKRVESEFEALRLELIEAYKDYRRVRSNSVTIIRSLKKGAIEYAKIPVLKGLDLEKFRKPTTEVVTVKVNK